MSSLKYILSWMSSFIFLKHEWIDDDAHKAHLFSWKLEPKFLSFEADSIISLKIKVSWSKEELGVVRRQKRLNSV